MNIITGYIGDEHVTSQQFADTQSDVFGSGDCVLNVGTRFAYEMVNSNTMRISAGQASLQGRIASIDYGSTEDVTIASGSQGQTRSDIVCIRYQKNASTLVESVALYVAQGASGGADPSINSGTVIREGASIHDMPLYRVRLSGVNIAGVDQMWTPSETTKFDVMKQTIFDSMYPIGSIYTSIVNQPPSYGTWVAWGAGRCIFGVEASDADFSTPSKMGGKKGVMSHNHAFTGTAGNTGAQSANHTHSMTHTHYYGNNVLSVIASENWIIDQGFPATPLKSQFTVFANQMSAIGGSLAGAISNFFTWWANLGTNPVGRMSGNYNAFKSVDAFSGNTGTISASHGHAFTPAGTVSYTGDADANLPPYITAYFFRRTA